MPEIKINGETRQIPDALTITGLIDQLGYAGKRIAVEKNGEIVPKSQHPTTVLAADDQLEIVVAVGGG
jgi:sulfur carrier protein